MQMFATTYTLGIHTLHVSLNWGYRQDCHMPRHITKTVKLGSRLRHLLRKIEVETPAENSKELRTEIVAQNMFLPDLSDDENVFSLSTICGLYIQKL